MKRRSAIKTLSLGAGYTMSGLAFTSFISGCKQEGSLSSMSETWQPSFMSSAESKLVENILEALLPTTESSPGAKALNIVQVVDNVVNKLFKKVDQEDFSAGLEELKNRIEKEYQVGAPELSAIQLDQFMERYMGTKNSTEQKELARLLKMNKDAFTQEQSADFLFAQLLNTLRQQGISAYFGNETIATEHLSYDPVPGVYMGCIPLSDIGNSWAL